MEITTQQTQQGEKIIFIDGKDKYACESNARAVEVFKNWLHGERLPKPKIKS